MFLEDASAEMRSLVMWINDRQWRCTSPLWWTRSHPGLWLLNQPLLQPHLPHTQSTHLSATPRARPGGLNLSKASGRVFMGWNTHSVQIWVLTCEMWIFWCLLSCHRRQAGNLCERVSYPSFSGPSCIEVPVVPVLLWSKYFGGLPSPLQLLFTYPPWVVFPIISH